MTRAYTSVEPLHSKMVRIFELCPADRPTVIQIGHIDPFLSPGGTEKFILKEANYFESIEYNCIQVFPNTDRVLIPYYLIRIGNEVFSECKIEEIVQILDQIAQKSKIEFLMIHHLLNWPMADFQRLFNGVGFSPVMKRIFYLHDFYGLCPSKNFAFQDDRYCGAVPIGSQICGVCRYGSARESNFISFLNIFEECDALICPSEVVRTIYRRHLPHLSDRLLVSPHQVLIPHENIPSKTKSKRSLLRIGFIGTESLIKGWDMWVNLVTSPELLRMFTFVQLGGFKIHLPRNVEYRPMKFSKENPNSGEKHLREADLDVFLILSRVPETFSFAFFESIAAGVPVIAFTVSGNVAYQLYRANQSIGRLYHSYDAFYSSLVSGEINWKVVEEWKRNLPGGRLQYNPAPLFQNA